MDTWYMDDSDEDQRLPHKLDPNQPVPLEDLEKIGVFYWRVCNGTQVRGNFVYTNSSVNAV